MMYFSTVGCKSVTRVRFSGCRFQSTVQKQDKILEALSKRGGGDYNPVIFEQSLRQTSVPAGIAAFPDPLNHDASLANIQLLINKKEIEREVINEKLTAEQKELIKLGQWTPPMMTLMKLTLTKHYRHAVSFFKFIKAGIKNVWNTYLSLRAHVYKGYYVLDNSLTTGDMPSGLAEDRKIAIGNNPKVITDHLSNYFHNVKAEVSSANVQGSTIFSYSGEGVFTRSMYQAVLRTRKDIIKLPMFAVLFGLIEEGLIPLCYAFPGIAPSSCVLPQLHGRFYGDASKAQKELEALREAKYGPDLSRVGSLTPFNMPVDELYLVVRSLRLCYSTRIYSEGHLRELLANRWKQVKLDNLLILRDGGIWRLSTLETLDACITRGLIDLEQLVRWGKKDDINLYDSIDCTELHTRLFHFINECEKPGRNAGMLGLSTMAKTAQETLALSDK
ncbi:unnamed protein product [Kuraishia capsulata CBS 1993]|uniref:Letm1 RBD domain-containing protein n=1 Tax=Kuraishia capsulata CBS 1993 TaxID=1382522 RepID=W6MHZ4_9ASCO|nr:uncharacterized protein KUCA_T00001651001 [Kuraishia capsulata CBS 1993]CDK25681.1 unnamed protein product [Kuraishia capsulata CBS 1993]